MKALIDLMPVLPPIVTKVASTALNLVFDIPLSEGNYVRRLFNRANKNLYITFDDTPPSPTTADFSVLAGRTEVLPMGVTQLTAIYADSPNVRGLSLIEEPVVSEDSSPVIHMTYSSTVDVVGMGDDDNAYAYRMLAKLPDDAIGFDCLSETLTYNVPRGLEGSITAVVVKDIGADGANVAVVFGRVLTGKNGQDIEVFRCHANGPKRVIVDSTGDTPYMPTSSAFFDSLLTDSTVVLGAGDVPHTAQVGDIIVRYHRVIDIAGSEMNPVVKIACRMLTDDS